MKHHLLTLLLPALWVAGANAQGRTETELAHGWQFSRDQQTWQTVDVPHDWAIAGPFDKKWDIQVVRIEQNGEKEASEKTGRSGALPWIGQGFYKRTFSIPQDFSGHAELLFDGAMSQPVVSVNGQWAGCWAYGYNSFRIDITDFVRPGDNLLEVSLTNQEESSRWYPGAGIYRPVTLILTDKTHIDDWSLFARTVALGADKAELEVDMDVEPFASATPLLRPASPVQVPVRPHYSFTLLDADGNTVAATAPAAMGDSRGVHARLTVANPHPWSPETPYLYKLVARLTDGDRLVDAKTINVGLRTVRVGRDHGFQLNGQSRKLRGVCLHHDLGPLGAAVNKSALIRQVKMMKAMGCDAIRTSHNMPSQMQMDVCDSLGMMVMAESFDMWIYPKCRNGYARFFQQWADLDITNLVRAHRNHPSIVMWSIGNEIPEQWSEQGRQIAIRLQGICHSLDPTRPVTQGCDRPDNALASGFVQAMDVPGFNYRIHKYKSGYEHLPQGFLLGSETTSTVSSRGVYHFPVVAEAADNPTSNLQRLHRSGQCSGYDVNHCSWSNLPDDDWRWQDDMPWVIGEFVWTGYDYLGEPSPYDGYWPSRSSYFGICDLAGLPKDRYFLYRSHWNTTEHTIHLLPHWSWPDERRGEVTPVYCYTDYPTAELFVNGKSQGRITKQTDNISAIDDYQANPTRLDRYRLRWNDVRYEPGELRVVVYDAQGHNAGERVVHTAGKPARLVLKAWTQAAADILSATDTSTPQTKAAPPALRADGRDLAFVTVTLTDKHGNPIPAADDQLTFEVSGNGTFEAACNGDATSLESFRQPTMRLFAGQLVVVVRSSDRPGSVTLKVTDAARKLSGTITLPTTATW